MDDSTPTKRALLLINPGSRSGADAINNAIKELAQKNIELVEVVNRKPSCFPERIVDHRDQVDVVIVGGGDGSINAAIHGLTETSLPLGVLPLGTANNLARSLGIPTDLTAASEVIRSGEPKPVDLGWVNGKYFLNVAGMGLSTQINRTIPAASKRRWGVLAYVFWAAKVLWRMRPFWAEIKVDGNRALCIRSHQIVVCNGKHYGSGLTIAEDAAIDDQALDLCSIQVSTLWDAIKVIPALKNGNYRESSLTLPLRSREIEIRTHHPLVIDTDGEVTTRTPAIFKVIPKALCVYAPVQQKPAEVLQSA